MITHDNLYSGEKCKDPGISNNNTLRHEQIRDDGFLPLQVLHYHCVSGYLIEGKNSITCQADGTWDGILPQCYREYKLKVVLHRKILNQFYYFYKN